VTGQRGCARRALVAASERDVHVSEVLESAAATLGVERTTIARVGLRALDGALFVVVTPEARPCAEAVPARSSTC